MNQEIKVRNSARGIFFVAGFVLLIKLILLPFAQATDPDAVNRILISIHWMKHPTWIMTDNWGPFHYYFNALFLSLWNNQIYTPAMANIFLSVLTLFPFYYFVRREFNEKGAFIATIFLAICPILFRNSFLALSETPYLFFLVLAMNFISKGMSGEKNIYFIIAGLFITIASGFRYEAWLLTLVFIFVLLLLNKQKAVFIFGSIALLFPTIWICQSYYGTGNTLHNFQWAINADNGIQSFQSFLRRISFFPFSWMIALGPPIAFITGREIIIRLKKEKRNKNSQMIWTIPFWIILLFFICNSLNGTLLLQHRFTGTLIILSLPFCAIYFNEYTTQKIRIAVVSGILTLGLSFIWNTSGAKPLPRLKDQSAETVSRLVKTEMNTESGVILDFWNWENTYYLALQCISSGDNAIIIGETANSETTKKLISELLKNHPQVIILLKKDSNLFHEITLMENQLKFKWIESPLLIKNIYENNEVMVLKYSSIDEKTTS